MTSTALTDTPTATPGIWPELAKQLGHFSPTFPAEAFALADAHRDEVAPHLLADLERVVADPQLVNGDSALHVCAMHLLAAWRDTRAAAPLLAACRLDEESLDLLMGDAVTESLPACLASVCTDTAALRSLYEDPSLWIMVRHGILRAMAIQVLEGDRDRTELIEYMATQGALAADLARGPDPVQEDGELLDGIVMVAKDIGALALSETIQSWYRDDLLDTMMTGNLNNILEGLAKSPDELRHTMRERDEGYVRDVKSAIGWMWRNPEPPTNPLEFLKGGEFPNGLSANGRRPQAAWDPAPPLIPVTTVVRDEPKVGRNDPCPCGSGKKYKKCHGA